MTDNPFDLHDVMPMLDVDTDELGSKARRSIRRSMTRQVLEENSSKKEEKKSKPVAASVRLEPFDLTNGLEAFRQSGCGIRAVDIDGFARKMKKNNMAVFAVSNASAGPALIVRRYVNPYVDRTVPTILTRGVSIVRSSDLPSGFWCYIADKKVKGSVEFAKALAEEKSWATYIVRCLL